MVQIIAYIKTIYWIIALIAFVNRTLDNGFYSTNKTSIIQMTI